MKNNLSKSIKKATLGIIPGVAFLRYNEYKKFLIQDGLIAYIYYTAKLKVPALSFLFYQKIYDKQATKEE